MGTPSSLVGTHVNQRSYASTNPLHSDSHLTLQRVDIRGGYHWFYIAAAWHWAHPSTLFMRAKWEPVIWESEETLFSNLCISDQRSTSLYRLLCKPLGQERRGWRLWGWRGAWMLTHCHHEAVLSSTPSPPLPIPPPFALSQPLLSPP